jgi:hypothetical protein
VGWAQGLVVISTPVAYLILPWVAGPLTYPQWLVVLVTLEFVVQPVSTLIHELGHAAVARRVTNGPVSVAVGRGPYLRFAVDRVQVNFSFLPSRGVLFRGVCRFDPAGVSWRNRARLALAGPAATFVELCLAVAIAARIWGDAGALARNMIALAALGLLISLVMNLIPRTTGPIPNDGAQARAALKNDRAQLALPKARATSPSPRPAIRKAVPMSAEVAAFAARQPRAEPPPAIDPASERARKSVPPPDMV